MPEPMTEETAPEKREPKHVSADLLNESAKLRALWNTNVNHPKALEASRLCDLLEEAASLISRKVK